jgi:hypothetical protein
MDPNSPIKPLEQARPSVPGVPEVPDVPQIPNTAPAQAQPLEQPAKPAETPKITGISMPAGSSKKPESPTQRSNKINAANAPKSQDPEKKQKLLHKPVTMEEVEAYRRKSAKKKRRIFISIVIFIVVAGMASAATVFYLKNQSYEKLSSVYNKTFLSPLGIREQTKLFYIRKMAKNLAINTKMLRILSPIVVLRNIFKTTKLTTLSSLAMEKRFLVQQIL